MKTTRIIAIGVVLQATPQQAEGAAGALLDTAKQKLQPSDWSQVSAAGATAAFSKLGLKPEMVAKAVPILTQYVSKTGGAGVGSLLAGALK